MRVINSKMNPDTGIKTFYEQASKAAVEKVRSNMHNHVHEN